MINVALLRPGTRTPVTWEVPNEPEAVRRVTRKLARLTDGPVECCYEAGPCGYVLSVVPVCVTPSAPASLASPKSRIFTTPLLATSPVGRQTGASLITTVPGRGLVGEHVKVLGRT